MFSRREGLAAEQPARDATPQPTNTTSSAESLIAQEDTFEGEIKTNTGVRVLGTVRGTIESQRYVRVESGATVEADIMAEEVVIAGTFSGSLICRNRVEIADTGHVTGKVETMKLYLHEGGFFDGELRMQRPGEAAPATTTTEEARPRRSRYVDLGSEQSRAVGENAPDAAPTTTPEATS
jgi:cytoskeletal protein CcmA (bactofilin family)